MKKWWPIIIEFIMVFAVLYIVQTIFYPEYSFTFLSILAMSFVVTVILYLLGDTYILPRYGNISTTLAEFGLAWVAIWGFGNLWYKPVYPWASIALVSAVIIAVGKWFFHSYINQHMRVE